MSREIKGIFISSETFPYIEMLSYEQCGKLLMMIFSYAENGIIPDFSDDLALKIVFHIVKDKMKIVYEPLKRRATKEYKEWREAVFKRDNYTCQMCGQHGGKLNAHHIERYSKCVERRTDVSNGVTLCERCHRLLHKMEGI